MAGGARRPFPSVRLAARCGMAGPIGFTLAWIAFGAAWPGYDPRADYISELAAAGAPLAVPMVGAFLLLGALTLLHAAGLWRGLGPGAAAAVVAGCVGFHGAATIASGLARCDRGCGGDSLANRLHTLVTYAGLGVLVLGVLALPWAVGRDPRWRGYRLYSWLTGLLAIAIFLRGFASFGGVGLGQRLFISLLFLWLVLVAARLHRVGATAAQAMGGDGG